MTLAQRLALLKGNRNLNRNAEGVENDIADGRTDTYRDEPKDGAVRAAPSSAPGCSNGSAGCAPPAPLSSLREQRFAQYPRGQNKATPRLPRACVVTSLRRA